MRFYRVFPDPRLMIDADTVEGREALTALYRLPERPSVRINMIITPSGDTVGVDGTSGTLSTPTDRHLVRLLRAQSDAVILGAETLRRERIPLPTDRPLIILTSRGELSWHNLIADSMTGQVVVMTDNPERDIDAPAGLSPQVVTVPPGELSPGRIIDLCRDQGWNHLLVEGGKRTACSFAQSLVVDDLCLTLTGPPTQDTSPPVSWWPKSAIWETKHLLTDDSRMLFYRFHAPSQNHALSAR